MIGNRLIQYSPAVFTTYAMFAMVGLLITTEPSERFSAFSSDIEKAEFSLDVMLEKYWNDDLQMFNNAYPCNNCNEQFHYWWQAHAIDVLLDGYELTGDEEFLGYVDKLYAGLLDRNGGDLFNNYYDDMLWMGLALHRAYTLTGTVEYKDRAVELWDDIAMSWNNEFGGGIPWRRTQTDYKNAPSNGPAVILAVRLYQTIGEESYLEWGQRIYSWLKETLMDSETSLIWDGVNRQGDHQIDKNWMFTYNQGTFAGAAIELWQATGNSQYLDDAEINVHAAFDHLTNDQGIFTESGQGDGGLFKGILVRYLREFDKAMNRDSFVRNNLILNARSAWDTRLDSGVFGPSWIDQNSGKIDFSSHLSGMKLILMTARFGS